MSFYDRYLEKMATLYPRTASLAEIRERLTNTLISPSVLDLPREIASTAQHIVGAYFALRQSSAYRTFIDEKRQKEGRPVFHDPGNFSALSCFDFHLLPDGGLKLIEINTNASAALIADLLYRLHGLDNGFCDDFRREILTTFENELRLQTRATHRAAIVDEAPESQRLFVEFQLYAELFTTNGWETLIVDPSRLSYVDGRLTVDRQPIDLVYNRHTDFYFESEPMRAIATAFQEKTATISPNAFEYMLLADKERMQDLTPLTADNGSELATRFGLKAEHAAQIARSLLKTHDITSFASADDAWSARKGYFFKPKRSFGGKAVYRGSSVSRTTFDTQVWPNEYIAQEYAAPPTVTLAPSAEQPGGTFKYDLRFYTYQDRVQLACARLYQGQATNTQSPGGGITAIRWL